MRRGMRINLATIFVVTAWSCSAFAADVSVNELAKMLFGAKDGQPIDLSGKSFSGLDLSGLNFKKASLTKADLFGTDLSDASLAGADLRNAKLDRATIVRTDFSGADLSSATILVPAAFTQADKAGQEAPRFANAKLDGLRAIGNFRQVDFSRAVLTGANFSPLSPRFNNDAYPASRRTGLRSCNFNAANLSKSNFRHAILEFSTFVNADLSNTDFTDADFTKADLTGANLEGADVSRANFDSANLTGVIGFDKAVGLSTARNLDRARR